MEVWEGGTQEIFGKKDGCSLPVDSHCCASKEVYSDLLGKE